jgi:hypothetical protein
VPLEVAAPHHVLAQREDDGVLGHGPAGGLDENRESDGRNDGP